MVLSLLLVSYLAAGIVLSDIRSSSEQSMGVKVDLVDPANKFISKADVYARVKEVSGETRNVPVYSIDLDAIERHLNSFENIEWANVERRYYGDTAFINIEVMAMQPVARIFLTPQQSYYVNRTGKRMNATYECRAEVPMFKAHFDSAAQIKNYLTLIDYLKLDTDMAKFATEFKIEPDGDIIMIPLITNHVINLGDTSVLADKMKRLRRFYEVVPNLKGWEYYDTISVKWKKQVVATRRNKASSTPKFNMDTIDDWGGDDNFDVSVLTVPNWEEEEVSVGQKTTEQDNNKKPQ